MDCWKDIGIIISSNHNHFGSHMSYFVKIITQNHGIYTAITNLPQSIGNICNAEFVKYNQKSQIYVELQTLFSPVCQYIYNNHEYNIINMRKLQHIAAKIQNIDHMHHFRKQIYDYLIQFIASSFNWNKEQYECKENEDYYTAIQKII